MPFVTLKNITNYACRDINLEINNGELMVILGPNGSGKTTLLNIIAGLIKYHGTIMFDGVPIDQVPTSKRKIGYLFQNLLLFPHMNVYNNIAYSLKIRKWQMTEIEERIKYLFGLLNIKHLSDRYPHQLSGGEKQRVALARALAPAPEILLLDEPLSSLDIQSAKFLRMELKQIQKQLGITTLYVTHNFEEAEEMADRIAVLYEGRLEQVGKPQKIFFFPENERVLDFIGTPNILECDRCREIGHGVVEVVCGDLPIIVPHEGNSIHKIAFFPRDIYISAVKPPGPDVNRFKGTVTGITIKHDTAKINVRTGTNNLVSEMPLYIFEDLNIAVDQQVFIILKLRKIRVYENENI